MSQHDLQSLEEACKKIREVRRLEGHDGSVRSVSFSPDVPVSIIDMESYWVSETAASYGIPHMVVRSVLDPVGQTLPAFIEEAVSEDSGSNWARAVKYAVAKPMETPKLLQLAGQAKVARASLAEFLGP